MKIACSMGDPNGIGPEVLLKALQQLQDESTGLVPMVFGPPAYLEALAEDLGIQLSTTGIQVEAVGSYPYPPSWGRTSKEAGEVARTCLARAAAACQEEGISLLVTAPVNKQALHLAGFSDPGQTEFLSRFFNAEETAMIFFSDLLKVALVTVHLPLKDVAGALTQDRIVTVGRLFRGALERLGYDRPTIAVCGLNPHASEAGLFGTEEAEIVAPAIEILRKEGPVEGPIPGDTVFHAALNGRYQGVVALYHDQGLIPVKTLAFDTAVNVTLGLPGVVRTSPDHGTAFDIAGQHRASASSMVSAIRWGIRLASDLT